MQELTADEIELTDLNWEESADELKSVAQKLQQIRIHKRELSKIHYMVYAGLTSQLLIIIIIIGITLK